MNAGSQSTLRITVAPAGTKKALRFENHLGERLDVGDVGSIASFDGKHAAFRNRLEGLKNLAQGGLKLDWSNTTASVAALYSLGALFLLEVIQRDELGPLSKLCEKAIMTRNVTSGFPQIQILSHGRTAFASHFPFEFLPLFGLPPPGRIENHTQLEEALSRFLGFSAVVTRQSFDKVSHLRMSPNTKQLPMRFFQYASLPTASRELEFFTRRPDIDVDGPWTFDAERGTAATLARYMYSPCTDFAGEPRDLDDQVQHFCCHTDTLGDDQPYLLLLESEDGTRAEVSLDDLRTASAVLELDESCEGRAVRPLIFLNSCGGGAADPRQIGSFADYFYRENRNRGFIGTHTMIPDEVAGAFSAIFYENFLKRHACIGEAMTRARTTFAMRYQNPLSILYVYYGAPEITIEPAETLQ